MLKQEDLRVNVYVLTPLKRLARIVKLLTNGKVRLEYQNPDEVDLDPKILNRIFYDDRHFTFKE